MQAGFGNLASDLAWAGRRKWQTILDNVVCPWQLLGAFLTEQRSPMSTQCPSAPASFDAADLPRTMLLVAGARAAQDAGADADRLAAEAAELLDTLEQTIERLALAHRGCIPAAEDRQADDEAFEWVQQSLEDISATLRGLALGRAGSLATKAQ